MKQRLSDFISAHSFCLNVLGVFGFLTLLTLLMGFLRPLSILNLVATSLTMMIPIGFGIAIVRQQWASFTKANYYISFPPDHPSLGAVERIANDERFASALEYTSKFDMRVVIHQGHANRSIGFIYLDDYIQAKLALT